MVSIVAQTVKFYASIIYCRSNMPDYRHEHDLAKAVVMDYLESTTKASAKRLTRAFYSSTNLHSSDNEGRLEIVPRDRFIRFTGADNFPKHSNQLLSIEVIEDMV